MDVRPTMTTSDSTPRWQRHRPYFLIGTLEAHLASVNALMGLFTVLSGGPRQTWMEAASFIMGGKRKDSISQVL